MKLKKLTLIGFAATALYGLSSCDKHEHANKGHDHDENGKHVEGDGDDHEKDGDGHVHNKKAGPSGGRVLHEFEPHAEFFVLEDRKVRITFVDDDYNPIPAGEQVALVIAGDRSAPTQLAFTKEGDVLVSDNSLPGTDDFPVIVQIAERAGTEKVSAKFQANMLDCPSCDYLEYACICDHDEE